MRKSRVKIFHCGDIHLDSVFSALGLEDAKRKRREMLDTFGKMTEYASENCDIMLISGDLFDCEYCSTSTFSAVCDYFGKMKCPVVISPGNHDPYTRNSLYKTRDIPENVYIFNNEDMGKYDFDEIGITVCGYAFTSERYNSNPLLRGERIDLSDGNYNILCAHADTSSALSGYAPLTPENIAGYGFCLGALGHIHKKTNDVTIGTCLVEYSGFAFGRSFDEPGYGGARVVTLSESDGKILAESEKIVFAKYHYESEEIDITGAKNDADVTLKIKEIIAVKGFGEDTSLRVTLSGAVDPSLDIDEKKLCKDITEVGLLQIKNMTSPTLDIGFLADDPSLRGEFYRLLESKMRNATGDDERRVIYDALRLGLSALS